MIKNLPENQSNSSINNKYTFPLAFAGIHYSIDGKMESCCLNTIAEAVEKIRSVDLVRSELFIEVFPEYKEMMLKYDH